MLQEGNAWNVDIVYNLFEPPPDIPCCYTVTHTVTLGNIVTINGLDYRETMSTGSESFLLRENNGLVYKYIESTQEELLMFDFTLEVGDVFNVSESIYTDFPNIHVSCVTNDLFSYVYESELHVSDVDYVVLAGEERKIITFEENSAWFNYVWIEGIGNMTGFDLMNEMIDITDYSILSCFTTGEDTYFMFGATSCDNTTLNTQEHMLSKIVLSPNPVTNSAILQIPEESGIDQLVILDASGRKLVESKIETSTYPINGELYASGLYFYQVLSEGRLLKTSSFIIR